MQKKMLLVLCVVELMEALLESSTSPMGSALCRTAPSKPAPSAPTEESVYIIPVAM